MIQIEQTADGSQTLFVPELNEHYHSVKGALTESEHIFIQMGLKHSSVEARLRYRTERFPHAADSRYRPTEHPLYNAGTLSRYAGID